MISRGWTWPCWTSRSGRRGIRLIGVTTLGQGYLSPSRGTQKFFDVERSTKKQMEKEWQE